MKFLQKWQENQLNKKLHEAQKRSQKIKEEKNMMKKKEQIIMIIKTLADPEETSENKPFTLYEEDNKETTTAQLYSKNNEELFTIAEELFEEAKKQRLMW